MPVFNERSTVAEIVRRMRAVDLPIDLEIVIVDDGSCDGTDVVLSALRCPAVRLVAHTLNRGKGAAIRTGLAHIRGDLVLVQDADLEYDPEDWPALLEPVLSGRATVVYGNRLAGAGTDMKLMRRLANRFLTLVTNVLYSTALSDMETCYKLFDRRVLDGITIDSDGFEFEPEITAKLARRGVPICEVPISYAGRERHDGKKIAWRDGVTALSVLVRYRFGRPG